MDRSKIWQTATLVKPGRDNSFRKAFYHLQSALDFFDDVIRDVPVAISGKAAKKYSEKVRWIFSDFKTSPAIPKYALNEFSEEFSGDMMFHTEISRKCLMLSDEQKAVIENIIDDVIAGKETIVQIQ